MRLQTLTANYRAKRKAHTPQSRSNIDSRACSSYHAAVYLSQEFLSLILTEIVKQACTTKSRSFDVSTPRTSPQSLSIADLIAASHTVFRKYKVRPQETKIFQNLLFLVALEKPQDTWRERIQRIVQRCADDIEHSDNENTSENAIKSITKTGGAGKDRFRDLLSDTKGPAEKPHTKSYKVAPFHSQKIVQVRQPSHLREHAALTIGIARVKCTDTHTRRFYGLWMEALQRWEHCVFGSKCIERQQSMKTSENQAHYQCWKLSQMLHCWLEVLKISQKHRFRLENLRVLQATRIQSKVLHTLSLYVLDRKDVEKKICWLGSAHEHTFQRRFFLEWNEFVRAAWEVRECKLSRYKHVHTRKWLHRLLWSWRIVSEACERTKTAVVRVSRQRQRQMVACNFTAWKYYHRKKSSELNEYVRKCRLHIASNVFQIWKCVYRVRIVVQRVRRTVQSSKVFQAWKHFRDEHFIWESHSVSARALYYLNLLRNCFNAICWNRKNSQRIHNERKVVWKRIHTYQKREILTLWQCKAKERTVIRNVFPTVLKLFWTRWTHIFGRRREINGRRKRNAIRTCRKVLAAWAFRVQIRRKRKQFGAYKRRKQLRSLISHWRFLTLFHQRVKRYQRRITASRVEHLRRLVWEAWKLSHLLRHSIATTHQTLRGKRYSARILAFWHSYCLQKRQRIKLLALWKKRSEKMNLRSKFTYWKRWNAQKRTYTVALAQSHAFGCVNRQRRIVRRWRANAAKSRFENAAKLTFERKRTKAFLRHWRRIVEALRGLIALQARWMARDTRKTWRRCLYHWKNCLITSKQLENCKFSWEIAKRKRELFQSITLWKSFCTTEQKLRAVSEQTEKRIKAVGLCFWRQRARYCRLRKRVLLCSEMNAWKHWKEYVRRHRLVRNRFFTTASMSVRRRAYSGLFRWRCFVLEAQSNAQKRYLLCFEMTRQKISLWRHRHALSKQERLRKCFSVERSNWSRKRSEWRVWKLFLKRKKAERRVRKGELLGLFSWTLDTWRRRHTERQRTRYLMRAAERIRSRCVLFRWKRASEMEREAFMSLRNQWEAIQCHRIVERWRQFVSEQRPSRTFIVSQTQKRKRELFYLWRAFAVLRKSERFLRQNTENRIRKQTEFRFWRHWRTAFLLFAFRRKASLRLLQIARSQAQKRALHRWKKTAQQDVNVRDFEVRQHVRMCSNVFVSWKRSFYDRKEALRVEKQLEMVHECFLLGCIRERICKRVGNWRKCTFLREKRADRNLQIAFNDLRAHAIRQRQIRFATDDFLARWKGSPGVRLRKIIFMWKFRLERQAIDMWAFETLRSKRNERNRTCLSLLCHSISLEEAWLSWKIRLRVERLRRRARSRENRRIESRFFLWWKAFTASICKQEKATLEVAFLRKKQMHLQVLKTWRRATRKCREQRDFHLAQKVRTCLIIWHKRSISQRDHRRKCERIFVIKTRYVFRRLWDFWYSRVCYSHRLAVLCLMCIAERRKSILKAIFYGWNVHRQMRCKYREFHASQTFRRKSVFFIDWRQQTLLGRKKNLLTQLFIGKSVHRQILWSIRQWRQITIRVKKQRQAHRLLERCSQRTWKKRLFCLWKHTFRFWKLCKVNKLRFQAEAQSRCLKQWKIFYFKKTARNHFQAAHRLKRKKRLIGCAWAFWKDLQNRQTRSKGIHRYFRSKRIRRVFNDMKESIRRKQLQRSRVASFRSSTCRKRTDSLWRRWNQHLRKQYQLQCLTLAVACDVKSLCQARAWKSWKYASWLVKRSIAGCKKRSFLLWRGILIRKHKKNQLALDFANRHASMRAKRQAFSGWFVHHRRFWVKRRKKLGANRFRRRRLFEMSFTAWKHEKVQKQRQRHRVDRFVLVRRYKVLYKAFSSLSRLSIATRMKTQRFQMAEEHHKSVFFRLSWKYWRRGIVAKTQQEQRKSSALYKGFFSLRKCHFNIWKRYTLRKRDVDTNIFIFQSRTKCQSMQRVLCVWRDRVARRKEHYQKRRNADFARKLCLWGRWKDSGKQKKWFRSMFIFWRSWGVQQRHETCVQARLETFYRQAVLKEFLLTWRGNRLRKIRVRAFGEQCINRRYVEKPFRLLCAYTKRLQRFEKILGVERNSNRIAENVLLQWKRHSISSYAKTDVTWALWRRLFLGKRFHRSCQSRRTFEAWKTRLLSRHRRTENLCAFIYRTAGGKRKKFFSAWKQFHFFGIEWRRRRHREIVLGQLVVKRIQQYHSSLLRSVMKTWISWKNEKKLLGNLLSSYSKAKQIFKAWQAWKHFTLKYSRHKRQSIRIAAYHCRYQSLRFAFNQFVRRYLYQKRTQRIARGISYRYLTRGRFLAVRKWCQWKRYIKLLRYRQNRNRSKYFIHWKNWVHLHREYRLRNLCIAQSYLLHLQRASWCTWTTYRHHRLQQQVLKRNRVRMYLSRWKERCRRTEAYSEAISIICSLQKQKYVACCRLSLHLWRQLSRRSQNVSLLVRDHKSGFWRQWVSAYYCKLARRYNLMSRYRQAGKLLLRWHVHTKMIRSVMRKCLILHSQRAQRYTKAVFAEWTRVIWEIKRCQFAVCRMRGLRLRFSLRVWRHNSVLGGRKWDVAIAYDRHTTYRRIWSIWGEHVRYKRGYRAQVVQGILVVEKVCNRYKSLRAWRRWKCFNESLRIAARNLQRRRHLRMKLIFTEWKTWSHCVRIARKRARRCFEKQRQKALAKVFWLWKEYTLAWKMMQVTK